MSGLREFLNGPAGKAVAIAIVIVAAGAALWAFRSSFGPPSEVADANRRVYIDAKTMKPFTVELTPGLQVPLTAPSGGQTGYPAELCYWTADGKPKNDPTPVLLKTWLGESGPTFCPDCHRLVVAHNPRPGPGVNPPPTESEYKAKRESSSGHGSDR